MKIGVISDTHLRHDDLWIRWIAEHIFPDADLILHAGDLVDLSVLQAFGGKEVKAVCGNMDPLSVREVLPEKIVFEVDHHRIGLMHGWGSPNGLAERLLHETGNVDCLVYGHSHRPDNRFQDGVLLFNPGSPTENRFTRANTVGVLHVGETITGEIIELKKRTR